jgi:hypothetical protein
LSTVAKRPEPAIRNTGPRRSLTRAARIASNGLARGKRVGVGCDRKSTLAELVGEVEKKDRG